jgi:hypothetical protein
LAGLHDIQQQLSKIELHRLADGLLVEEPGAVETCVRFVIAESTGHWHGRARAMICRRLKHIELELSQREMLVECITARLASGRFSEQFRDQLRLALALDPEKTYACARAGAASAKPYIRRYATWVLAHASAPR